MGNLFPYSDELAKLLQQQPAVPAVLPQIAATEPYVPEYLVGDMKEEQEKSSFTLHKKTEDVFYEQTSQVTIWSSDETRLTANAISQAITFSEMLSKKFANGGAPTTLHEMALQAIGPENIDKLQEAADTLIDMLAAELESGKEGPVGANIKAKMGEQYYSLVRDLALSRSPSALSRELRAISDKLEESLGL